MVGLGLEGQRLLALVLGDGQHAVRGEELREELVEELLAAVLDPVLEALGVSLSNGPSGLSSDFAR